MAGKELQEHKPLIGKPQTRDKMVHIAVEHTIHGLRKMTQTTSKGYIFYVFTVKTAYVINHGTMHRLS